MEVKDHDTGTLTLEDRVRRLEIGNLYKSVTHRLLQVYDEQRTMSETRGERFNQALAAEPAVGTEVSFGVKEAARQLGCSTKTVHKLCNEKRLAFHWVGNRRRFRPQYVSQFVEAQSGTTKTRNPLGVDEKSGSRLRFSGSSTAGRPKKGGGKKGNAKENNRTEAEILASLRERMREWD
jgi:excisionase family DNA binding protein